MSLIAMKRNYLICKFIDQKKELANERGGLWCTLRTTITDI